MGVIVDELEITSSVPPSKFFKGYILDSDNLVPKIIPIFKSFKTIEGNGGAGTVKLLTFLEGEQVKTAKHRTDELDEKNQVFKYSLIEGGILGDDFECVTYVHKFEPGPNGGTVYKVTCSYHTKGNNQHSIQQKIKEGKEGAKAFFHAIESYLQAHPHEYN